MVAREAILISFNGKSNAGGVERVVYYLDEYFHSRGIATKIIDEPYLVNHTWFGRLFQQLFRFRHFRKRKTIYLARYTSAFIWLTRRSHNVVISQGESLPFYPAHFVFIHGSYHCMELAYGRKDPRLSRIAALQQRSCMMARQIIAVSAKVKQDLITYYHVPAEKIIIQNNCVDTARFYPSGKKTAQRRTLLYVGRLVKEKGLGALQQLAPVIEQSDDWQLLIACNDTPDIAFFADFRHTSVKTGLDISNIGTEAYAFADLLIVPSMFEGFELVTLEALSAGIPVTGTRVGAISELLDRGFPGVYLLPEIAYDNPEILSHFDNVLAAFHSSTNPHTLHQQVAEAFGIEEYMKKMDIIVGPSFFHTR
ncbi:glycosyltransferase family 4 protein [Chitinophaga polysaccharea]|uniref:glycosyltransferase family 4 protein n=1 Tax=Chitinophaga polysaccharea TaxID=1293035 RepID=UPI0011591171|nr:glycosyltransferase [Chitinophaga polysaccharea]